MITGSIPRKIAIFGYFGANNLGDEAVVGLLLQKIRDRLPQAEVHAICLNPDDSRKNHGIPAFPIRRLAGAGQTPREENGDHGAVTHPGIWWVRRAIRRIVFILPKEVLFLAVSYRRLRGFDLIIVGGSGQLIDNEGGPWNHPYNHFKWAVLARLAGAKFAFASVGAGPLDTRTGRMFVRKALSYAAYRSFRDTASKELVERLGVRSGNLICPDQAFSIHSDAPPPPRRADTKSLVVGVAPVAWYDPRHWPQNNPGIYRAYVGKMAEFVAWLAGNGYRVILFDTVVNADDLVIDDLLCRLRETDGGRVPVGVEVHPVRWYDDALAAISRSDLVVASRFHAILFSCLLGRPAIGISYHQKIDDMMAGLGQGDFALDIRHFTPPGLIEAFERLVSKREEIVHEVAAKRTEYRRMLERQYDTLFSVNGG